MPDQNTGVDVGTNDADRLDQSADSHEKTQVEELRDAMKSSDWVANLFDTKKESKAAGGDPNPGEEAKAQATAVGPGETNAADVEAAVEAGAAMRVGAEKQKPAEAQKPAPKRKKEQPQARQPTIDTSAVAEAAAEAAARTAQKIESTKAAEAEDDAPEDFQKLASAYAELERMNPQKYKGVAKKALRYRKDEEARARKWQEDNPGEVYDPDAKEHAEWHKDHDPGIDPDDFDNARIRAAARELLEQEVAPEISRARVEIQRARVEPVSNAAASAVTESLLRVMIKEGQITENAVRKLAEDDPEKFGVVSALDSQYREVARAVPLLYHALARFDDRNPAHVEARNLTRKMESELAQEDQDALVRGGKMWVPIADYYQMPEHERGQVWVVSDHDVSKYVALTAAQKAEEAVAAEEKRLEAIAKKRGWVKAAATDATQGEPSKKPESSTQAAVAKPTTKSPSTSAAPAASAKNGAKDISQDPMAPIWERMGLPA